ncbi:hypothetical protein QTP86_016569 [Hemibagrus guttatus]|nr:hypothetical protein QTP86_016569 [Hemibagrus guttatus]
MQVFGSTPDHRLEAEASSDSTALTIRDLKLSDSAVYHCALSCSTMIQTEAADNSIKPDQTNVFSMEGRNISLSCTYTGSVYRLHWYRQKPGFRPDFLLLTDESGKHVTEAQPPHPRLSIKQDKTSKKVDLIIPLLLYQTLHYTTVLWSPQ